MHTEIQLICIFVYLYQLYSNILYTHKKLTALIWHNKYTCSCCSSICGTYIVLSAVCNTTDDRGLHWDRFYCFILHLHNLCRLHEQLGTLQLWAYPCGAVLHLSSSQVHHVYAHVSLPFSICVAKYIEYSTKS